MEYQDQYQEYLKRIKLAEHNHSAGFGLRQLNDKTEQILTSLRSQITAGDYRKIFLILFIPFILVALWTFFMYGGYGRIVALVLIIVYSVYMRIQMKKDIGASHSAFLEDEQVSTDISEVEDKVQYIKKGLCIKRKRVGLTKVFYMIFFPIFMYMVVESLIGSIPFQNIFLGLTIAFLVGSFIWTIYFAEDLEELKYFEDSMKSNLNLSNQSV